MSLRLLSGLAVGLGLLSATALAVQSHDRGGRLDDLEVAARSEFVSAPHRPVAPVTRSGDRRAVSVPDIDPAWVATTAGTSGIPAPAVRAYARAQLTAPQGCGIGWTTLAGIGYVESQHGTIGGRTLLTGGRSSSPILGPALDGTGDVASIRSTSTSRGLHGDPVWEHAVGPMQFLPGTWDRYATDGDGDGRADPLDLDDAAAAAVRYLCTDGHDLSTGAGWAAAVFSYNHAQAYVDAVYAAATSYADRSAS